MKTGSTLISALIFSVFAILVMGCAATPKRQGKRDDRALARLLAPDDTKGRVRQVGKPGPLRRFLLQQTDR